MATTNEIITAYGQAWNEQDEAKRRKLLELSWADDGVFTDPQSNVSGRDALMTHIAAFHTQFAGAKIVPTSGPDEHHGRVRFTWRIDNADGSAMMNGIDVAELAPDGRIAHTVGFFGDPPPAP